MTTSITVSADKLYMTDLEQTLESDISTAAEADSRAPAASALVATKKRQLVAGGDLAALKRIRKGRNARFVLQDVTLAARGGHLDAVVWLCKHARGGYPCRVIQEASAGGHLAVVKWLCEAGRIAVRPGAIDSAIDAAARQGHNDVIDYLVTKHGGKGTPVGLFWAVRNGHADTIRRLCAICPENASAYYAVSHNGNSPPPELVAGDDAKALEALNVQVVAGDHPEAFGLFDLACLIGRIDIVRWMWEHDAGKWTRHIYVLAATGRGSTDMVDFLYARRSSIKAAIAPDEYDDEPVVAAATLGGSVAKVAAWHFGMSMPVVLSRSNVADVAARGHLDMINFLQTKGAPVHPRTCLLAACEGGSVAVAAYMIDAGAAIDEEAVKKAVRRGHSDIVRLLYARGGEIRVGEWPLYEAVHHCDADVVALLRRVGRAPVKSRMIVQSVLRGCPDVMAVLCDRETMPGSTPSIDHAATVAHAVGHPKFDVDRALDQAIAEGNLPAVDALLDVRPAVLGAQPYRMRDHFCQRTHFDAISRVADRCEIAWETEDYTINNAVMRGGLRVVQWFHARGLLDGQRRDQVTSAVPFAATNGKRSTVEFLWEHGFRPTLMQSPPLCDVCDDQPAEDHCAAQAFLRQKIAEADAASGGGAD
ncbi:Ankyrin repeat domain containing protein [Pandoravirus salinus]|uniref:Ankyrin repeat domain containing protein n=1 Tax=Pandoravirus salinus TaxID=1349410 RepID=S4VXM0_9VIRU|nr:ankyrin repeat domain [Pandoravirus salinus]AGO85108.1 Ankyrin repeat domain containing protein [Pandoravirus salinus]